MGDLLAGEGQGAVLADREGDGVVHAAQEALRAPPAPGPSRSAVRPSSMRRRRLHTPPSRARLSAVATRQSHQAPPICRGLSQFSSRSKYAKFFQH